MNRMPLGDFRRLFDHLGKRRMGVDGGFDFVPGGFEVHGEADLGDHLGAFAADDVGTDDFTVGFAIKNFDEAFGLGSGEGLKYFETGRAQFYALIVFGGVIALVVLFGAFG